MKKKVIIFGATDTGKRIFEDIRQKEDVLYFVDQDPKLRGADRRN